MSNETKPSSRLWVAVPTAILAGVAPIFLFFLFMVLYSYVIDPGHEESYYQDFANRHGPLASIVGGIPVFFLTGVVLRRFLGERALKVAIAAWGLNGAIYLAILIAAGQFIAYLPHIVVSLVTKLGAIYLGARVTNKKPNGESE